jgi:hypothetical protein
MWFFRGSEIRKGGNAVRAKFRCESITYYTYGGRELTFNGVYDAGTTENEGFSNVTPSGRLTMVLDNPAAAEFFTLGKEYYLDFTEA